MVRVNRVMFDPARGMKGAAPGKDLSPGLRACAPYIKLLDEALAQLMRRETTTERITTPAR
jgi:hypothetical protein